MLKVSVVFLCCVVCAFAAVAIAPLEPKPEKFKDQEGCYISDLDAVVPYGETRASTVKCVGYWCDKDSYTINGCGVLKVDNNTEIIEEKDKPYPEYCPKIKLTIIES